MGYNAQFKQLRVKSGVHTVCKFTSTDTKSLALEENGHGVFTRAFHDVCKYRIGEFPEKFLLISTTSTAVTERVMERTEEVGLLQVPLFTRSFLPIHQNHLTDSGDFVLYDPKSEFDRRVAVIIGCNTYRNTPLKDLRCAVADGQLMGGLLKSLGFECILLLEEHWNRESIISTLSRICRELTENSQFLFFFAGHSMHTEFGQHILPYNESDSPKLHEQGFHMQKLVQLAKTIKSCQQMYVVDAVQANCQLSSMSISNNVLGSWNIDEMLRYVGTCPIAEPPEEADQIVWDEWYEDAWYHGTKERDNITFLSDGGNPCSNLYILDEFNSPDACGCIILHYLCNQMDESKMPNTRGGGGGKNVPLARQSTLLRLVKEVYKRTFSFYRDPHGRDKLQICLHASSDEVKRWALSIGTKYGRYKLTNHERPIYRSKTCEVYTGIDVEDNDASVCLKIIHDGENFRGEKDARDKAELNQDYVVAVSKFLSNEEISQFPTIYETIEGKTVPSWKAKAHLDTGEYAVVMPCADKSLYEAVASERFAGHDPDQVHLIAKCIADALNDMHTKNLVHGDVKPRNIVRIDGRYKIIDLDAAERIGDDIGRKYSSAFAPPELAKLIFTASGESIDEIRARSGVTVANALDNDDSAPGLPSVNMPVALPAPRQLLKNVVPSFDVWGFGCVFYGLCAGRQLFADIDSSDDNIYEPRTAKELINWTQIDNIRLSYVFQDLPATNKSKLFAIDLIRKCLCGDETKRLPTMEAVLKHPYFNMVSDLEKQLEGMKTENTKLKEEITRQSESTVGSRGDNPVKKKSAINLLTDLYSDGSYAVLIAINNYQSANISEADGGMRNLISAVDDANAIEERLLARGFNESNIKKLFDSDATKTGIERLLGEVERMLEGKRNARLIFFLASHGVEIKNKAYVCCHGTNTKERVGLFKMSLLKDFAEDIAAKHQLYLLDCCHSGGLFIGTRGQPTAYELKMMGSPAIYGMTSVSRNQEALEANGHGLFTQSILSALDGNIEQFKKEPPNEYITANELFSYVSKQVFDKSTEIYEREVNGGYKCKHCLCGGGKTYGQCKQCRQTPKFQLLLQSHQGDNCDGQFIFVRNVTGEVGLGGLRKRSSSSRQSERKKESKNPKSD